MVEDEEQPNNNTRQYFSGTNHSRVCVKGIVSCHAFGWGGFLAVGATVSGSWGQVLTLDVSEWVLGVWTIKGQTPSFAGCGIRFSFVKGKSWWLCLCPWGDQASTSIHFVLYLRFNFVWVFWETGSGTGSGRPRQTWSDLSLICCSGPPPCRHGGERRVWVVAESMRCLHGKGFDAIR